MCVNIFECNSEAVSLKSDVAYHDTEFLLQPAEALGLGHTSSTHRAFLRSAFAVVETGLSDVRRSLSSSTFCSVEHLVSEFPSGLGTRIPRSHLGWRPPLVSFFNYDHQACVSHLG